MVFFNNLLEHFTNWCSLANPWQLRRTLSSQAKRGICFCSFAVGFSLPATTHDEACPERSRGKSARRGYQRPIYTKERNALEIFVSGTAGTPFLTCDRRTERTPSSFLAAHRTYTLTEPALSPSSMADGKRGSTAWAGRRSGRPLDRGPHTARA